jgi:hypothetical protein
LRAGYRWDGTNAEKKYILQEARSQFHRNKDLTDANEIERLLFEADARLTTGVHYRNPYPRLHNVPPGTTGQNVAERMEHAGGPQSQDGFQF